MSYLYFLYSIIDKNSHRHTGANQEFRKSGPGKRYYI